VELGRRWRRALADEGLPEFHAAQMEFRRKPHDNIDHDRKEFLQRKFIGLIAERDIWGFNHFVQIDALIAHESALKKHMTHTEPHTFCFRMAVEILAVEVERLSSQE